MNGWRNDPTKQVKFYLISSFLSFILDDFVLEISPLNCVFFRH